MCLSVIDWRNEELCSAAENLKVTPIFPTTQIEHYDHFAKAFFLMF
jgi:hypothetical protein